MSAASKFVHLHNHSEYSFLDGAIRVKDLVKRAAEFGMPALALTDHGGMFGAIEFHTACLGAGIKPVIGFEAYVAPGSRFDKTREGSHERSYYHLILLAQNNEGYRNLLKLSSIGYQEGFYYKPRIDLDVLREHSAGVIATSACIAGAIPRALAKGAMDKARQIATEYLTIFGEGNFYLELQDHGIPEEAIANKGLIEMGKEMGIPLIVANDAHYLNQADASSHEVLLCIQTRATLSDPNHYKFSSDQIYFKSPQEMMDLFVGMDEAYANTVAIAERCNVEVKSKPQLPVLAVPGGFDSQGDFLRHLAHAGLKEKYAHVTPGLEGRLENELKIICEMGFAGYFLIVRDFVQAAIDRDIMVGCRGSAAGSLVAYCVNITNVDPIKFDLIFERFLNPERVSMPDADIDFADKDRYRVIDYVVDKYGRDSVSQIINFGRMKAKMVVKDVARVMGVEPSEAQHLSNMVTEKNLKLSLENNGELARAVENNPLYQEIFRHAKVLEGLARQAGMHAGGVIIAPGPVVQWAPLFMQPGSDIVMTQFDMKTVEESGLIKMDFLGLRTLTVLQEAVRLIRRYHGVAIDLWKIADGDKESYELFGRGDTIGVFQFESQGMQDYLRKLKPNNIEDIIAMAALYRPGPMDNIDTYIHRKHGKEKVEYLHPMLEEVLAVTNGVIIYQEQVMRIAQVMGGFTLGQADILRKAMGKKMVDKMESMGKKFVEGALKKGIDKKIASDVFDLMAKFAAYGFNKAHATVYAHVSYQAAYLKAHYPAEYMTACLSSYLGNQDQFLIMKTEAERMGLRVLPPDVNASENGCTIENGQIRLGMGSIKNVGKAVDAIEKARAAKNKFDTIFDLCASVDMQSVNKSALDALICAGALDSLPGTRAQLAAAIETAVEYAASFQKDRSSGQTSLFESLAPGADAEAGLIVPEPQLPAVEPWPYNLLLQKEKEVLNFYVSGHPLDRYRDEIIGFAGVRLGPDDLEHLRKGQAVTVGGLITSLKQHTQRNGKLMAFGELEDFDGSIELVVFSDVFAMFRTVMAPDVMVLVHGKIDKRDGDGKPKLIVDRVLPLSESREKLARSVHLRMRTQGLEQDFLKDISHQCASLAGECALIIHLVTQENNEFRIISKTCKVNPGPDTIALLRKQLGKENVWLGKTAA